MVVATACVVVHLEGVAIENVERSIAAADQRVVATARVIVHRTGVAIEDVGRIRAADQRVVTAAGVVVHAEGVAIKNVERTSEADQRVIAAALMVGERSGLGIRDRLWHGRLPQCERSRCPIWTTSKQVCRRATARAAADASDRPSWCRSA